MTRRLALHIGHSKTGSSYLQSTLALSREALAGAGFAYPDSGNQRRARAGLMTTGNGDDLRRAMRPDETDGGAAWRPPEGATVIYSAEHLAPLLAGPGAVDRLRDLARQNGFTRIDILLIIRDPMDHLLSEYSQKIKGGQTITLARLSKKYGYPIMVLKLVQAMADCPEITLTIRNYRRVRDDLAGAFASWLGVPSNHLTAPQQRVVNRSLTSDELAFQRLLNTHMERSGHVIAEHLMADLPHQPRRSPILGRKETRAFFRRLSPAIRAVNRVAPRAERYHTGGPFRLWAPSRLFAGFRRRDIRLSADQVAAIVKGFVVEIDRVRDQPSRKGD